MVTEVLGNPRAGIGGERELLGEERHHSAAVGDAAVGGRVAFGDTSEHERGDRQSLGESRHPLRCNARTR